MGSLEPNEDPVDGARREAHEETGLSVTPTALVGVYHRSPGVAVDTRTVFVYEATVDDANAVPRPPEDESVMDVGWYAPKAFDDLEIRAPYVEAAVRDHHAGQRYPLDLTTVL